MKVQTFLPVFNGFYNTLFEDLIDNATEFAIDNHNETNGTVLNYDDFDFDFITLKNEICKYAASKIEEKLNEIGINCTINFETLISPREYNFDNDSINIEINFKKFSQVIEILERNYNLFTQYIKDNYTSCSGFISSYSNYSSDWMEDLKNVAENETHKVGAVLDFILQEVEEYKPENLYFELCENCYEINFTIKE